MSTQTEASVARTPDDTEWDARRPRGRRAVRANFAALKPTLLVVGAVVVIAAVAVGVSLIVWSPPSAGDIGVSETDYRIATQSKETFRSR